MTTPDEFLCPITLTLMSDPVIGGDGHTYERSAITQWLLTNPHSPLTRQSMTAQSLKPNYALKTAIDRFKRTPSPQPRQQQPQKKVAPKKAPRPYEPIPQLIPRLPQQQQQQPQPSAPPADDLMIAIQLQQAELSQPLLPVVRPQVHVDANQRQKKFLALCLCFIIVVIFIIMISKLLE